MKRSPTIARAEPSRAAWAVALAVLALLVALVFWPSLRGEFVWDDRYNVVENPRVHGWTLGNVQWAFTQSHGGHYQPLTWITYMVDHALGGLEPWTYHVTNVLWHVLDVVLFAVLARELLRIAARRTDVAVDERALFLGAVAAAAVFGLHPLRVESVAWITERRDVVCGAFFLLAILAYLRAIDRGSGAPLHMGWYGASIAFFVVSLLSKALGMALPIVLLVIDVFPLRRHEATPWTKLFLEKLPFFACAIASGLVALGAQSEAGALAGAAEHGVASRIAQAFYGIVFYPRAMLAAKEWYPLHERPIPLDPSETRFVLAAIAAVGVTIALFAWRRRAPALCAVWFAYLALLAPVTGIAQSGPQLVADRYSYLSCMSFALLLGGGVAEWWRRGNSRVACVSVTLLVLAYWGVSSWRQTYVWRDDRSLWAHIVELGPTALAFNNVGDAANRKGERAEALAAFARSLALMPTYPYARANLVERLLAEDAAADRGALQGAADALRRSLDVLPLDDAQGWYALGVARTQLQDAARAEEAFTRATELAPDLSPAWSKLGLVRYLRQDRAGAVTAYENAIALDATNADAWLGLGIASIESGDASRAADAFRKATELSPESSFAWTGLGSSLWMRGEADAARSALERALVLEPGNARAAATLAEVRAGSR